MFAAAESDRSSFAGPVLAGAAVAGGLLLRRNWRRSADREVPDAAPPVATTTTTTAPAGRWIYPLPRWQGRAPVISDGWGSPRDGGGRLHRGVDLMYRRRSRDELASVFRPRAPHSDWHFLPPGTLVLAASDGDVWSAGWSDRGNVIVLSHGTPWATCYRHLARLFVGETSRWASRERVRAGQPIGVVGADPTDARGIAHLHFEVWYQGGAEAAIDPAPLLRWWEIVDPPATPAVRAVS